MVGIDEQVALTNDGEDFSLSRAEVIETMTGFAPERINSWYVEVDGQRYPTTQVVRHSLNVKYDRNDITVASGVARRYLKRLGMNPGRVRGT